MAQQQEPNDLSKQPDLDNARVGYQVAVSLWIHEGELIWSKFNALLVANSIILAAIGVTKVRRPALGALQAFSRSACP